MSEPTSFYIPTEPGASADVQKLESDVRNLRVTTTATAAALANKTASPTPSTLVERDESGGASFASIQVDTGASAGRVLTSDADGNGTWKAVTGSATATANTLVQRDGSASAAFQMVSVSHPPTMAGHATNKFYVDSQIAPVSGAKYKGNWSSGATYQSGNLVSQPVIIQIDSQLYASSVTPSTVYTRGTIYNGLVVQFAKSGTVTGVQIYIPTGSRPDSGYTVYFNVPSGVTSSKLLPKASIVDGWNNVLFDEGISVVTGMYYLVYYRSDAGAGALSSNATPFGAITSNYIVPFSTWTSRSVDSESMNTKVLGSDDLSFVTTKGHDVVAPITTEANKGRYVRFTQPTAGYVNFNEIEVYLKNSTTNIALGKAVTQSSFYDAIANPASNATDGNYDTFVSTNNVGSQWVQIDLGAEYANIGTINLINRVGATSSRAMGGVLTVRNSGNSVVWTSEPFHGKSGSTTFVDGNGDGFSYYVVNGAFSYNVSPLFTAHTDSTTTATLYEAKTTTTGNAPAFSPTQWQSILTGSMINAEPPEPLLPITSSFTPTLGGSGGGSFATASSSATYTLMGKLCFVQYYLPWTSKGSATGALRCSLPFASSNSYGQSRWVMTIGWIRGFNIVSSREITAVISQNSSWMNFYVKYMDGASSADLNITSTFAGGDITMSGWYLIA